MPFYEASCWRSSKLGRGALLEWSLGTAHAREGRRLEARLVRHLLWGAGGRMHRVMRLWLGWVERARAARNEREARGFWHEHMLQRCFRGWWAWAAPLIGDAYPSVSILACRRSNPPDRALQMRWPIHCRCAQTFTRAHMTPAWPTNTIADVRREATQLAKQWKMDLVVDTWRENILFWDAGSGWCEAGGERVKASVPVFALYRTHH